MGNGYRLLRIQGSFRSVLAQYICPTQRWGMAATQRHRDRSQGPALAMLTSSRP
jgi:hypothetical protein